MKFYANKDSVCFLAVVTNPFNGELVDPSSATVEIRKCRSDSQRDWEAGELVLNPSTMTNFSQGIMRYVWSSVSSNAGTYVAELVVVREAVTNSYRDTFALV